MRSPGVVRFPLVSLPDPILTKLVNGFRQSDCEICKALVRQLGLEARRRASDSFAMVEVTLPPVTRPEAYDAKIALMVCATSMLEAADAAGTTLESPSSFQLAAEFAVEVVHALERQELEQRFSAATNAAN